MSTMLLALVPRGLAKEGFNGVVIISQKQTFGACTLWYYREESSFCWQHQKEGCHKVMVLDH